MRWWETEGRRHAGMKRVKSERMGVYALFAIVVLGRRRASAVLFSRLAMKTAR